MKSTLRTILYATLLMPLLTACGSETDASKDSETNQTPVKATSVQIQVVTPQDLDEYFTLPGTLEAWEDLTLAAEISGPVDWVGPEEGATVEAGEAIMTIDSVSQKANLKSARVDAETKLASMRRIEQLVDEKLVSEQEHDANVNAYEAARQNLKLAKIALEKSTVKAPVSGVLDRRFVERGEYIGAGDPVALVVQVDKLKALVEVPEKDVRYLHKGEKVSVIQAQIDTGEELFRLGELVHLAYKADPQTRTYRAKIEVDNQDGQLRPGMIIRIEAIRRHLWNSVAIPLYSVVDLDGRKVVFVEDKGRARMRPVKIDRIIGDQVVIAEGLDVNERLIVRGQQLLTDGAKVRVEAE
jgi:membrane fusion protein (multidrug efflux system)